MNINLEYDIPGEFAHFNARGHDPALGVVVAFSDARFLALISSLRYWLCLEVNSALGGGEIIFWRDDARLFGLRLVGRADLLLALSFRRVLFNLCIRLDMKLGFPILILPGAETRDRVWV